MTGLNSCKGLKSNPRILIVLNRFVIGGPSGDTIPLAWHLKDNFDILILYGEKEKDELEAFFLLQQYPGLLLQKVPYLTRRINPFFDILAFVGVFKAILRFKPHIVHTHGAKSGILGRVTARLLGVPVILHTFHGHSFHSYFSKKLSRIVVLTERLLGKITTAVIALSQNQKKELSSEFRIVPASKIYIVPLGFDFKQLGQFITPRENFRNKYGLLPTDVAIGIVGRIVAIKNHSFFVNVISQLLSENKANSPAFFIIGDGDRRSQIENELTRKKILFSSQKVSQEVRVVFTSWLTDIDEVMNGLDISVLTSLNEGTPLSLIEAQFFKKPVVCTNVGGVQDTVIDGKTGFLIEKCDLTEFCKKICLLTESKELRIAMGEEGNRFVTGRFSKEKEVEVFKALYFSLLKLRSHCF